MCGDTVQTFQSAIDSIQTFSQLDSVHLILYKGDSPTSFVDWFPSIVALAAIFLGPYLTFKLGTKQAETQAKMSSERIISDIKARSQHEWIIEFRQAISEYNSALSMLLINLRVSKDRTPEINKYTELALMLESKIKLMLNDKDIDEKNIIDLAAEASGKIQPDSDWSDLQQTLGKLNKAANTVMKKNWDRL